MAEHKFPPLSPRQPSYLINPLVPHSYGAVPELILEYFEKRKYQWPSTYEALGWVSTELGEVHEVLQSMVGGWVRNNPDEKPLGKFQEVGEELGDVMMMLIVAGLTLEVDVLAEMISKIKRKMEELENGEKS